jgi:hypothetical protein
VTEQSESVPESAVENKYARLPPPIRREDLRTSHDVVPHPEVVGEADRERDWLLRTTGIFI